MTDTIPEKADDIIQTRTRTKGFGVAASPFNGIKLELGVCVVLGILLWLGAEFITANEGTQLTVLLAYSFLSATWLALRTRIILRRCEAEQSPQ